MKFTGTSNADGLRKKFRLRQPAGAMVMLVEPGRVRRLGLSGAGKKTIGRTNATHSIAAIQTGYVLWIGFVGDQILIFFRDVIMVLSPILHPAARG